MRFCDVLNESNVELRKSESTFLGRRENEYVSNITIFGSQLLPARISIFDQNQEAEIFKFRWRRQSEFKNQLDLTSKILARMLHITDQHKFVLMLYSIP